jgi:hypothetical protein
VTDGRLLEQHDLTGRIQRGASLVEEFGLVKGHGEDVPAAWPQNSVHLGVGVVRVGDVLENVGGQHKVDAVVVVGEPGEVLMDHIAHERSARVAGPTYSLQR